MRKTILFLALFFLYGFCTIYFGTNIVSDNENRRIDKTFIVDTIEKDTVLEEAICKDYDTLLHKPLILMDRSTEEVLRVGSGQEFKIVTPKDIEQFYYKFKKWNTLNNKFFIQSVEASKSTLTVVLKGNIEGPIPDNLQDILVAFEEKLEKPLLDYEIVDFTIEKKYYWNPEKEIYDSFDKKVIIDIDELLPKKIAYNFYKESKELVWEGDTFDTLGIFKKLFPSHLVRQIPSGYVINAAFWKCKTCPVNREFYDYFDTIPVEFPFRNGVQTRLRQVFSFNGPNGKPRKMLYFSSSSELDYALTGRFSKAFMGAAILEKNVDHWKTIYFNPTFNFLGMFQHTPALEMLDLGKNEVFFLGEDQVGGAGGIYYGGIYVYGIYSNSLKEILHIPIASRGNGFSEWETTVSCDNKDGKEADLTAMIRGTIDSTDFRDWDIKHINKLSPKLGEAIKRHSKFHFIVLQTLSYDGVSMSYKLKSEEIKITQEEA